MKDYINILDWLKTRDLPQEFEVLDETQLAELLRRFYGEVNSKNGKPYSKSAVIGIRAGLNRYLQGPPHNCNKFYCNLTFCKLNTYLILTNAYLVLWRQNAATNKNI